MSTEFTSTDRTCTCKADPSLDVLRDMVAAGIDQRVASRILWAPEVPPSSPGPAVAAWVRARLKAALPWLRLPREVVR